MTPEKIRAVCALYRHGLEEANIPKERIVITGYPENQAQMLAHAHYLLDGIESYLSMEGKWGKVNRHFNSVQMLLWVARWYTLEDLMNHNRPEKLTRS